MYSSVLAPLSAEQRQILLTDAPLLTLPAVFATGADPRATHGQRYDLPSVRLCLTAAMRVFLPFDRGHWTLVSRAAPPLPALVWIASASGVLRRRASAGFFLASLAIRVNGQWLVGVVPPGPRLEKMPSPALGKRCVEPLRQDRSLPIWWLCVPRRAKRPGSRCGKAEKTKEIPVAHAVLPCLALRGRV